MTCLLPWKAALKVGSTGMKSTTIATHFLYKILYLWLGRDSLLTSVCFQFSSIKSFFSPLVHDILLLSQQDKQDKTCDRPQHFLWAQGPPQAHCRVRRFRLGLYYFNHKPIIFKYTLYFLTTVFVYKLCYNGRSVSSISEDSSSHRGIAYVIDQTNCWQAHSTPGV